MRLSEPERFPIVSHDRQIILGQGARIGARISDHLVPLVKRLRDLERAPGGKTVAAVRFALQRRQIIQARRDLRAGFLFLGDLGDGLALARGDDRFGQRLVPNAIDAIVLVVPLLKLGRW